MFSIQHFIWLFISFAVILGLYFYLKKTKPSLETVAKIGLYVWIVSEVIKVFGTIEIVPSADGSQYFPYLETNHLPFHLCSLQVLTLSVIRYAKTKVLKNLAAAFFTSTASIGALFALALPSVLGSIVPPAEAFIHPIAYQTFLYHAFLIATAFYFYTSGTVTYSKKEYWGTMKIMAVLTFITIYLNSALGHPVYSGNKLVSVEHTTNFFFSYLTPIGLVLKEKWMWFVYLLILVALAFLLIGLYYIPAFFGKKEKN